ncbi:MAG: hypothetical protein IT552_01975 [Sphingomonadaceae bacterium]|nr:hypothetical protein [Sphingomonadaceae bacterium]
MNANVEDRLAGSAAAPIRGSVAIDTDLVSRIGRLQVAIEFTSQAGQELVGNPAITVDMMGAFLGILAEEGNRICNDLDLAKGG